MQSPYLLMLDNLFLVYVEAIDMTGQSTNDSTASSIYMTAYKAQIKETPKKS
jgi:hypothetical protein